MHNLESLKRNLQNSLRGFDLLAIMFCFLLTTALANYNTSVLSFEQFLSLRMKMSNFISMIGLLVVLHCVYTAVGFYQFDQPSSIRKEVIQILKASFIGTGILLLFSVILPINMVNYGFLLIFWSSIFVVMLWGRLVLRIVFHRKWQRGKNLRDIIIVGTNKRALGLVQKIESMPELKYRIMGFIDTPSPKGNQDFRNSGYPLLASLDDFRFFLNNTAVDEVLICLPMKSYYEQTANIIALCEAQGVTVHLYTELFSLNLARSRIGFFEGLPMIRIATNPLKDWEITAKRLFDLVGSAVLLVLFSPVLLAITLLIKVTSPGPIFYVQKRLGKNKRLFNMYKFRSMVPDADHRQKELEHLNEVKGPAFKIKNDPRITPFGKFIRKNSIDELPQLYNVFKGDMSLVGPRPLPVRDYNNFQEDWHRRRFSVKPGITCLWQVGGRSNLTFNQWMELDMLYIDRCSLWLDIKILLQTVSAVIQNRGAV
jgi:exopolysaccharide biosynthesis polyprenyl glycosylphosphotransferase